MKINGEDIAQHGAKQWTVTMGYPELSNSSDWYEGSLAPQLFSSVPGFKTIQVTVALEGQDRAQIWENGRNLIQELLEPSTVQLDGFPNYFRVVLTNADQVETCMKRWHKATLNLKGYEYGDEITSTMEFAENDSSGTYSMTINNPGNLETPAVIEILPNIAKTSITISGAARNRYTGEEKSITIKNIYKDKRVVIDGESGLITESGFNKFSDVQLWELPSLKPGENVININQEVAEFTVKFKPRYL